MRLIDADKITKETIVEFVGENEGFISHCDMLWLLENQPTAYDVEKVVEQLDKASDYYECDEQGREHVQMVDLVETIEIVKGGGIDEKE